MRIPLKKSLASAVSAALLLSAPGICGNQALAGALAAKGASRAALPVSGHAASPLASIHGVRGLAPLALPSPAALGRMNGLPGAAPAVAGVAPAVAGVAPAVAGATPAALPAAVGAMAARAQAPAAHALPAAVAAVADPAALRAVANPEPNAGSEARLGALNRLFSGSKDAASVPNAAARVYSNRSSGLGRTARAIPETPSATGVAAAPSVATAQGALLKKYIAQFRTIPGVIDVTTRDGVKTFVDRVSGLQVPYHRVFLHFASKASLEAAEARDLIPTELEGIDYDVATFVVQNDILREHYQNRLQSIPGVRSVSVEMDLQDQPDGSKKWNRRFVVAFESQAALEKAQTDNLLPTLEGLDGYGIETKVAEQGTSGIGKMAGLALLPLAAMSPTLETSLWFIASFFVAAVIIFYGIHRARFGKTAHGTPEAPKTTYNGSSHSGRYRIRHPRHGEMAGFALLPLAAGLDIGTIGWIVAGAIAAVIVVAKISAPARARRKAEKAAREALLAKYKTQFRTIPGLIDVTTRDGVKTSFDGIDSYDSPYHHLVLHFASKTSLDAAQARSLIPAKLEGIDREIVTLVIPDGKLREHYQNRLQSIPGVRSVSVEMDLQDQPDGSKKWNRRFVVAFESQAALEKAQTDNLLPTLEGLDGYGIETKVAEQGTSGIGRMAGLALLPLAASLDIGMIGWIVFATISVIFVTYRLTDRRRARQKVLQAALLAEYKRQIMTIPGVVGITENTLFIPSFPPSPLDHMFNGPGLGTSYRRLLVLFRSQAELDKARAKKLLPDLDGLENYAIETKVAEQGTSGIGKMAALALLPLASVSGDLMTWLYVMGILQGLALAALVAYIIVAHKAEKRAEKIASELSAMADALSHASTAFSNVADALPSREKNQTRSASTHPSIPLAPGKYIGANGFEVVAFPLEHKKGTYYIRADGKSEGVPQFVQFYFIPSAGVAYHYGDRRENFTLAHFHDKDGIRHYDFVYGGFWGAFARRISLGIDLRTGELATLSATTRVARFGLPPPLLWHSGPFKKTLDVVDTGKLTLKH